MPESTPGTPRAAASSSDELVSPFASPQQQQQQLELQGEITQQPNNNSSSVSSISSRGCPGNFGPQSSCCYSLPAQADIEAEVSAELEVLLQQLDTDVHGRVKYASFRDLLQRSCSVGPFTSSSGCSSLGYRGS